MKNPAGQILFAFALLLCCTSTGSIAANDAKCVNLTWYGGTAGNSGKTIQGILYPVENKLIYDWKNGTMDFLWSLPEGMKSGDPDGFEGTWQQDHSRGKFSVKEHRKTRVFEGFWSADGRKKKHRLSIEYCK